ncbi:hypothetical protein BV20DRAFT_911460, partial [Pilatotrama ljubarskyi]
LSPIALVRTFQSCREVNAAVSAYTKRAFDIRILLRRYFEDPDDFLAVLSRTSALISGSTALQFFSRTCYPDSDLDLYVNMCSRRELGRWLLSAGYKFAPNRSQHQDFEAAVTDMQQVRRLSYHMPGVASIYTFLRPEIRDGLLTLSKVQVIVACRTPMEVILGFHSTCVMNVICYDKAYCLFPRATLEEQRSLLSYSTQGRATRRVEGIWKYTSRGFTMITHLADDEVLSPIHPTASFMFGPRMLGDRAMWTITL